MSNQRASVQASNSIQDGIIHAPGGGVVGRRGPLEVVQTAAARGIRGRVAQGLPNPSSTTRLGHEQDAHQRYFGSPH